MCYVRMNFRGFGGLPMELDMKLSVEDSPNSAGIVVDALRCIALAQKRHQGGVLTEVSAALMKRPPIQQTDDEGRRRDGENGSIRMYQRNIRRAKESESNASGHNRLGGADLEAKSGRFYGRYSCAHNSWFGGVLDSSQSGGKAQYKVRLGDSTGEPNKISLDDAVISVVHRSIVRGAGISFRTGNVGLTFSPRR